MPDCCKEDAKAMVKDGTPPGAAMMKAIANHKAGKHDEPDEDD